MKTCRCIYDQTAGISLFRRLASIIVLILGFSLTSFSSDAQFKSVSIDKPFFNPTLGETIRINFEVDAPGLLSAQILDRDGFVVRNLISSQKVENGKQELIWNGRDDKSVTVADEAYSLHLELTSNGKSYTYFPAESEGEELKAEAGYYDRQNKVFSLKLPKAARVHIQAGSAVMDPKTKKAMGPVLRTLCNRSPRIAGSLVEQWSGYSEGESSIYIPELPNFVMSTAATALPEPAIISIGNKEVTFWDYIAKREGTSLLKPPSGEHHHHRGLRTLDDVSPAMTLEPLNSEWSPKEKAWIVDGDTVEVSGRLTGPSAPYFIKQPGAIYVFINEKMVKKISGLNETFRVQVPLTDLSDGLQYIAVNAGSEWGPASANAFRFMKKGKESAKKE